MIPKKRFYDLRRVRVRGIQLNTCFPTWRFPKPFFYFLSVMNLDDFVFPENFPSWLDVVQLCWWFFGPLYQSTQTDVCSIYFFYYLSPISKHISHISKCVCQHFLEHFFQSIISIRDCWLKQEIFLGNTNSEDLYCTSSSSLLFFFDFSKWCF